MAVVALACGGAKAGDNQPAVLITPIAEIPTPVPTGPTPIPLPTTLIPMSGFGWPLAGGCLPKGDQLMPNAPRTYRNGIHEGVDFYGVDNCTAISKGTPVVAARPGVVVRADLDYRDITAADVTKYEANPNTDEALDSFRGRQVWVDHGVDAAGNRIITRYCHLSAVAEGIAKGSVVTKGQLIANVGNSGTPESVINPSAEMHLHFEIRVGNDFLGKGQTPAQVRALYVTAFGQ